MRILLLGKDGQVGWELQRSLAPLGELVMPDRAHADLAHPEALGAYVREIRPQVIVNAAAYTAVDRAESEPALARAVNAESPAVLARAAASLGAWLVHFSTDYVFDGSGSRAWREDDTVAPLSVYGRTKSDGESGILDAVETHLILRTSWVYAARGANFAKTMLRLAGEREGLRVIADQHGVPTGAELLADVAAYALRSSLATPSRAGTYHVAPAGETSWHGYATHVIEKARANGWSIVVKDIEAIKTSEYPTPAKRPANSRLDTTKLQSTFGLQMPPWQRGVDRMLAEII